MNVELHMPFTVKSPLCILFIVWKGKKFHSVAGINLKLQD